MLDDIVQLGSYGKTIIITVPSFRAIYLLWLRDFGMVNPIYYKGRKPWILKQRDGKRLVAVVEGILHKEMLQRQEKRQKYIPPNTASGLLLKVPEWWHITYGAVAAHSVMGYTRRYTASSMEIKRLKNCYEKYFFKKKLRKRLYKKNFRALKKAVLRFSSFLNISFFLNLCFVRKIR